MSNIQGINICKEVISLLEKLSDGWRHLHKPEILSNMDSAASQLLELYDVNRLLKLIWTIDILRENSSDIQVIKVLDILPSYEISELAKKFDSAFGEYTVDYMSQCLCKHVEGYATSSSASEILQPTFYLYFELVYYIYLCWCITC